MLVELKLNFFLSKSHSIYLFFSGGNYFVLNQNIIKYNITKFKRSNFRMAVITEFI